jgi:hypothetical protein
MAVVPADRTTGPTVPAPGLADTRQIDIATASSATGPSTAVPAPNADNWRASSGLHGDSDNPNGAPGPNSGLGTSPGR